MRIAVVSTVYKPTPPVGYGGIERVVAEYAEALRRAGHEVVLFGCEGSRFSGELVTVPAPSRAQHGVNRPGDKLSEEALCNAMQHRLSDRPVDFIHDWSFDNLYVLRHADRTPFLISSCIPAGADYVRPNLVAASAAHARQLGGGLPHVHYGLDLERYRFVAAKTTPAAHIAKVAPYKAQHEAIAAAVLARVPLDIYGVAEHRPYYRIVRALAATMPRITWKGETRDLAGVLGSARGLVQTPRWLDVLPLVAIQSLACGTPVIAYSAGGLPEQIRHGETGFVVSGIRGLADALQAVGELDPAACRAFAEERFSAARMVRDYLALFERLAAGETWLAGPGVARAGPAGAPAGAPGRDRIAGGAP